MTWTYEEPDKTVNTYVVDENGNRLYIPDILNGFPGMTEIVSLKETSATGWSASFGCLVNPYPYRPPAGWICDPSHREKSDYLGTHGTCSSCVPTLVGVIVKPEFEQDLLNLLHPAPMNIANLTITGLVIIVLLYLMFKVAKLS